MQNKIYKIYLDAGHGLHTKDKCSIDGSVIEWDLNNRVCKFVENNLAKYNCVVYRCDDPTGETDPAPTSKRLKAAELGGADICISIHHNISIAEPERATGVEAFIGVDATEKSKQIASTILHNLSMNTGLHNRGLKIGEITMCKPMSFPTMLIEGGFLTNYKDLSIITTDKGIKAYAKAISSALISHLSLTKDFNKSVLGEKDDSSEYYISTAWENLAKRKGPYSVLANAIADCDELEFYKVFDADGNAIHESICTPTNIHYVKVGSKDKKMDAWQTLKMRDKPSAKEGSVITEISYGTKLILKAKINSSYWYCATTDGKFIGYLYSGYLIELH